MIALAVQLTVLVIKVRRGLSPPSKCALPGAHRRGELSLCELPLIPLDICGANTQGAIGYMIQRALLNESRKIGIPKKVTTVVTQTIVNRDDPSFEHPPTSIY